jgi:hypothetical protein
VPTPTRTGSGDITFKYDTLKGGSVQKTVTLAPAKTGTGE